MAVFTSIEDLGRSTNQPIYLALGMFDGVHAGHHSVLSRSQEIARGNNGIAVAFTFPEHPASFLRPESAPSLLMNKDEKAKYLTQTGMDGVVLRTFDQEFANVEGLHFPSFLIARNAVGAVKSDLTLCSEIILQNVPASGVPMGLPSNKTVAHPWNNGAYTI